jgi:hypothetical protein
MRSLQDRRDLTVSFQASLQCLRHLVCVCLDSRLAFPALCGVAHVLIQLHDALIAAAKAWTACHVMDEVKALQRILKKIEVCTLQRKHRAYAPRRSLLALMIPRPFRLVIQLAIKIAVLAFELERLVVVVGIVQFCVHHFPNAGDRRVVTNKSICIASFVQLPYDFLLNLISVSFARPCCSLEIMLSPRERRPFKQNNSTFLVLGQIFRSMYRYCGTSGTLNVTVSGTRGTCQMYPLFRSLAMFQ